MAYITLDELKKILPEIMRDWIDKDDESWDWIFNEIEQKCHIGKKGKKNKKKKIDYIKDLMDVVYNSHEPKIIAIDSKTNAINVEVEEMHRKLIDMQGCINNIRLDISQAKSMAEVAKNRTEVKYNELASDPKVIIEKNIAGKLTDDEFYEKVTELRGEGISDLDIAKSLGLTSTWFRHRLCKRNRTDNTDWAKAQAVIMICESNGITKPELESLDLILSKYIKNPHLEEEPPIINCTYCEYNDGDGNCCKPTDCDKQEDKDNGANS